MLQWHTNSARSVTDVAMTMNENLFLTGSCGLMFLMSHSPQMSEVFAITRLNKPSQNSTIRAEKISQSVKNAKSGKKKKKNHLHSELKLQNSVKAQCCMYLEASLT